MRILQQDLGLGGHRITDLAPGQEQGDAATFEQLDLSKSISMLYPVAGDNVTMFFTDVDLTITGLFGMVRGTTPEATVRLVSGDDRLSVDRTHVSAYYSSGNGQLATFTPDVALIPANNFVWIIVDSTVASVDELHLTIKLLTNNG